MDSEERLLRTFERFRKALFDCDASALQDMIAEDYRGFDPQGQLQDKAMTLEAYCPGGVKLERYDVEDLEIRIIENVGIIIGTGRIQGMFAESAFAHHVRFLDVYIDKEGHWRLYVSQVTPLEGE